MKGATLALFLICVSAFSIVLKLPSVDSDNPPIEVMACQKDGYTQITVIFLDEDHPNPVIDFLYDIYRFFVWHRIYDIESFRVYEDRILFPDDFASVTSFFQTENLHTRNEIPLNDFETEDGQIVIYVNTWNHMFSNRPLHGYTYIAFHLKESTGCREDAERKYRAW